MNAREALHYLAAFPAPEDREAAVITLSAALDERDALLTACENVVAALNCKYDSATIEAEYGEQLRTLTKGD